MNLVFRWVESSFAVVLEGTILASVLIVLVLLVQWAMGRRIGPRWRFALWGIVLVRLLLPVVPDSKFSVFNAPTWFKREQPTTAIIRPAEIQIAQVERAGELVVVESISPAVYPTPAVAAIDWWQVASLLWFTGAICFLARLTFGNLWVWCKLRGRGMPCLNDPAHTALHIAARELGITRTPHLVETTLVNSPAVFGAFRPRLLVPPGFCQSRKGRTERDLRHVFLHELAHLKRGDLFVNALMAVAQAVHWCNPFVWLAMRQMRIERELACDQLALRVICSTSDERRAYGETILRLLEGMPVRRTFPSVVGIAEEKNSARQRLAQIASFKLKGQGSAPLGILVVSAVSLCGLTNARSTSAEHSIGSDVTAGAVLLQTEVEQLISEARELMETRQVDQAQSKLHQAQALAPDHRVVDYYLTLLKEHRDSIVDRPPIQFAREPWESPGKAFAQTWQNRTLPQPAPAARANSQLGRQAIAKKLQAIRIADYELRTPLKFSEIALELNKLVRMLDPEKQGLNFLLTNQAEDSVPLASSPPLDPLLPPLSIRDYEVTISPALRNVSVGALLDAIVDFATPPKGYENAPRLRYSIEEYGVVFSQRAAEREQFYTRTFRVDPNTFFQGLDLQFDPQQMQDTDEPVRISRVQQAVRQFFQGAGLTFENNQTNFPSGGTPVSAQRAIFLNDRTGILFARGTLRDLALIEQALQTHNARNPPQIMFAVEIVEVATMHALHELLGRMPGGGTRTRLTDPEFRKLKQTAGAKFTFQQMPSVTSGSGRAARAGTAEIGSVDLSASYRSKGQTIDISAAFVMNEESPKQTKIKKATIYDGQTFVLTPDPVVRLQQEELRRNYGLQIDARKLLPNKVAFITVLAIDPAGNRVKKDDAFLEKAASELPADPR